ncbi:MAG: HAD-IB family hydrolase [Candidatus Omnitrophica bacterium]|nr:HAD-IB family hydrolase [Candidatus Omnitrophota bacterium]
MNRSAFFDVDGTLVSCQTQQQLARLLYKEKILSHSQLLQIYFWYVWHHLGLIKSSIPIRTKAYGILTSKTKEEMDGLILKTFINYVQPRINTRLKTVVKKHQAEGYLVIAVSGTLDLLCKKVCEVFDISDFFATKLMVRNGRYIDKWENEILEGEEKAKLIRQLSRDKEIDLGDSYAYADSFSDIPFLSCVGNPVVVSGDRRLMRYARRHGWRILDDVS